MQLDNRVINHFAICFRPGHNNKYSLEMRSFISEAAHYCDDLDGLKNYIQSKMNNHKPSNYFKITDLFKIVPGNTFLSINRYDNKGDMLGILATIEIAKDEKK